MTARSDNFNRANGNLNGSTPSDGGSTWTQVGNVTTIQSNRIGPAFGNFSYDISFVEASATAGTSSCTMAVLGNAGGPALRVADASNAIIALALSGSLTLYKRVAGTNTQLGSVYSGTITAGDVISVSVDASHNITVKQGVTTRITATDSTGSTNTKVGHCFYSSSAGARIDDWSWADAGGGGTPVGLSTETDAALALSGVAIKALGLSTETDSAIGLAAVSVRAAGLATEVDTALALTSILIRPVGMAVETDTALALTTGISGPVGLATETDAAFALVAKQIAAVGMAVETDAALVPGVEAASVAPGGLSYSSGTESATRRRKFVVQDRGTLLVFATERDAQAAQAAIDKARASARAAEQQAKQISNRAGKRARAEASRAGDQALAGLLAAAPPVDVVSVPQLEEMAQAYRQADVMAHLLRIQDLDAAVRMWQELRDEEDDIAALLELA